MNIDIMQECLNFLENESLTYNIHNTNITRFLLENKCFSMLKLKITNYPQFYNMIVELKMYLEQIDRNTDIGYIYNKFLHYYNKFVNFEFCDSNKYYYQFVLNNIFIYLKVIRNLECKGEYLSSYGTNIFRINNILYRMIFIEKDKYKPRYIYNIDIMNHKSNILYIAENILSNKEYIILSKSFEDVNMNHIVIDKLLSRMVEITSYEKCVKNLKLHKHLFIYEINVYMYRVHSAFCNIFKKQIRYKPY